MRQECTPVVVVTHTQGCLAHPEVKVRAPDIIGYQRIMLSSTRSIFQFHLTYQLHFFVSQDSSRIPHGSGEGVHRNSSDEPQEAATPIPTMSSKKAIKAVAKQIQEGDYDEALQQSTQLIKQLKADSPDLPQLSVLRLS